MITLSTSLIPDRGPRISSGTWVSQGAQNLSQGAQNFIRDVGKSGGPELESGGPEFGSGMWVSQGAQFESGGTKFDIGKSGGTEFESGGTKLLNQGVQKLIGDRLTQEAELYNWGSQNLNFFLLRERREIQGIPQTAGAHKVKGQCSERGRG